VAGDLHFLVLVDVGKDVLSAFFEDERLLVEVKDLSLKFGGPHLQFQGLSDQIQRPQLILFRFTIHIIIIA